MLTPTVPSRSGSSRVASLSFSRAPPSTVIAAAPDGDAAAHLARLDVVARGEPLGARGPSAERWIDPFRHQALLSGQGLGGRVVPLEGRLAVARRKIVWDRQDPLERR
jgi:hypothetical protein